MQRGEFIEDYMLRSDLSPSCRTEDGIRVGQRRLIALPCTCGEDLCSGWAMVSPDLRKFHEERHGTVYVPTLRRAR